MSNIIKLSNGTAKLKDFVDRKTSREYYNVLYDNIDIQTAEKDLKFDMPKIEKANDVLVLGLIKELIIDEKTIEITKENIESMSADDFDLIKVEAINMINKEEKKTKES